MFGLGLVLAITMAAVAVEEKNGGGRTPTRSPNCRAAAERNRLARDIHDGFATGSPESAILIEQAQAFRGP